MAVSPEQLAHAVFTSVVNGSYPDSDDIYGAELAASALPEIVAYLQKAQEDVTEDIRKVSRDNAPELDSWISHARRLNDDITASHAKADEILKLAESEAALERELEDAEMQRKFLEGEIHFNDELSSKFGQLQLIVATLGQVEILAGGGELGDAIEVLSGVEEALQKMDGSGGLTIVVGLMRERAVVLKKGMLERVERGWGELVSINQAAGSIKIPREITGGEAMVSGERVVEALQTLALLSGKVDQLHQQIDTLLVTPLLDAQQGFVPKFSVAGGTLRIIGRSDDLSAKRLFTDLQLIFGFLNSQLPETITCTLSRIIVPSLITRLISTNLPCLVPSCPDDLPDFEALLDETRRFEDYLQQINWTQERELREWASRAPKVWLAKRRETCLDALRKVVAQGIRETKVVERTETQKVKKHEMEHSIGVGTQDAWNEDWKDEDEAPAVAAEVTKSLQMVMGDDDDASGWGLDEDLDIEEGGEEEEEPREEQKEKPKEQEEEEKPAGDDGLEDLDWGEWGEDVDEPTNPTTPVTADFTPTTSESAKSNSPPEKAPQTHTISKDVTLRENYTITSIPEAVLETILQTLSEATRLSTLPRNSITSAAPDLLLLPTLILAAYRALAPIHYVIDAGGGMYLYNDCMRLSEELMRIKNLENAKADVDLIMSFGKRMYAKELNSQRAVLTDYFDSAKGFVNCTSYPQSVECETTITNTVSHIRQLHNIWCTILSHSALSQSLGSLLNTVCMRLINDIEDISDIAVSESEKLAEFCEELTVLEGLFPLSPGGISTVAVYCGHWIKFRFLQQILESSMVDILYLWREGHLEGFWGEELCELVVALFADSENRRRCLDEIRKGR